MSPFKKTQGLRVQSTFKLLDKEWVWSGLGRFGRASLAEMGVGVGKLRTAGRLKEV
jgi:hypothetical protein